MSTVVGMSTVVVATGSGNIPIVGISCVSKLHVALLVVSYLGYSWVYFVVASNKQRKNLA